MEPSDRGETFVTYLERWRPRISQALEGAIQKELASAPEGGPQSDLRRYLYDPLMSFTESGGKRVRPALALLGAEAVGAPGDRALSVGVAIELFQSVALIHDDIADHGEMRRGVPCLHVTEGTGVAINVGDAALTTVFSSVLDDDSLDADLRLRLFGELADMAQRTLEGQALDLGWARDGRWDITENDYRFMATCKTAHYSAATPLVCGALCGGGSSEQIEVLRTFGLKAGLAFQLRDDLLNLVGSPDAQGKDLRSDITEGKRTLLSVWALGHLESGARDELLEILTSGSTNRDVLAHAVNLMRGAGAIEHARSEARRLIDEAKASLEGAKLVESARATLISLADFFVERAG